jgi:vacuolar-type H+-ATPase subunit F/Vma7
VGSKDTTVYRYCLRHALKFVAGVRNVYVVSQPSTQIKRIIAFANERDVQPGQQVILVDENKFSFSPKVIRAYLRQYRPHDGYNGQPFDGTVIVPRQCVLGTRLMGTKNDITKCRQPFRNETESLKRHHGERNIPRVEFFDRTGWLFQQFVKLGAQEAIQDILDYMILDSDTVFYQPYSPFLRTQGQSNRSVSFMPGEGRDCLNPP